MQVPADFTRQMQDLLGSESEAFFAALGEASPVSIRLNRKVDLTPDYERIPHCQSGYYLPSRPSFTLDPWLHAGVYYVQEAGSMYLEEFFKRYAHEARYVLDLCAAPGGKSTHLASLQDGRGLLVSNEVMPNRANILAENMIKWGYANTVVTNNQPRDFAALGGMFDVLVTDVPCSGEGMFRKESVAVQDWSPEAVLMCAQRQRSILSDVWDALKLGGLLLYSTCTFNAEEDEKNARWIANELGAKLLDEKHFYFHTGRNEGFYIAALRKTAEAPVFHLKATKGLSEQEALLQRLDKSLRCLKLGLTPFTEKGKDRIPTQALAMAIDADRSAWPAVQLDDATALHYLHGDAIRLSDDTPKGYVLLCYRDVPLGWGKNLGNRCNNLYPDPWRIRMNIDGLTCERVL